MHWLWTAILLQPQDVLKSSSGYKPFLHIMPSVYWIGLSALVAVISTVGVFGEPGWPRRVPAAIQAAWLLLLEVLFSSHYPIQTGCAPYIVAAGSATWLFLTEEER